MEKKDVVEQDDNKQGPPMKKRKLNMEQKLDGFLNDANDADVEMNENLNEKMDFGMLSNVSMLRGHTDVVKCIDWSNSYALYSGS